jgi:excisionase family DNA binding protein
MTPLYDINSAARLLSISPWTVRSYIAEGKLKAVRIGRRVLLQEVELERLVADGLSCAALKEASDNER